MSANLNSAAKCFELFEGDVPVAFIAVLHQPTKTRLDLKRVSRLVVLPDYQGIGIGRAFLDAIAELYVSEGHMFEIKTSARNLIGSLRSHPESKFAENGSGGGSSWRAMYWGFSPNNMKTGKVKYEARGKVKTATFLYEGVGCPPFVKAGGVWKCAFYGFSSGDKNSGKVRYKERSQCKTATFLYGATAHG